MNTHADRKVQEAIGVYVDSKSLEQAAKAIVAAGFDPEGVSLMSSVHTVQSHLHHLFEDGTDDSKLDFIAKESDDDPAHGLSPAAWSSPVIPLPRAPWWSPRRRSATWY